MAYFKINNNDYSKYVNALNVETEHNYNAETNAAGDTVVDYINKKRVIEVGIIPLDNAAMASLKADIEQFNVSVSFLNPNTKTLETGVNCIIPNNKVEYYTIQNGKVMYKAFTLQFEEL